MTALVFVECDTCNAKPGSPALCSGCLNNREVIRVLTEAQIPVPVPITINPIPLPPINIPIVNPPYCCWHEFDTGGTCVKCGHKQTTYWTYTHTPNTC